jgi:hypothetical protein
MPTTRLITAAITVAVTAAALAGPAAAVPGDAHDWHHQPHSWYAGKSTIQGSTQSDGATANAYVPPAALFAGNATTRAAAPPTWSANPKPIARTRAIVNAPASGVDSGSAGIGAAAGIGAFAIARAGIAVVRRRRIARSPSGAIH